ncbi:unnamed protein product [Owenia fusiformis]|uniref:AB hydrolase-1 domain-containing protein n=1 Tax=Owenia fusiformis TaxID=6347 RepID=A0A8S4PGM6_OWEFU|nr:unnamed protein product [Owenia fusiformis]
MKLRSGNKSDEKHSKGSQTNGSIQNNVKRKQMSKVEETKQSPLQQWMIFFLKSLWLLFLFTYVTIPVTVKLYPWIMMRGAFLNNVRWPPFVDLTSPETFGLDATINTYVKTNDDVTVGVWHMLPPKLRKEGIIEEQYFSDSLSDGTPIILYLHGNGGTRGGWHRVQLYKVLQSMYHVITLDYRGYGDSTGVPTEEGVVYDAVFLYKSIKRRSKDSPVFIWGHSLGSGVASKVAKVLCEDECPVGVVLESPFNNLRSAAANHPLTRPFFLLPRSIFNYVFLDAIEYCGVYFDSGTNLQSVNSPLLILHARDDKIVPFHLGEKLYQAALKNRVDTSSVTFREFDGEHNYGHKHIHKAPQLPSIIQNFVAKCTKK